MRLLSPYTTAMLRQPSSPSATAIAWRKVSLLIRELSRNTFIISALVATVILFAVLHFLNGICVKDALSSSAIVLTAFSFCFGAYSLRENHRWNRYSYTLNLLAAWNNQVREHLDVLDSEFSDFRKVPKDRTGWGISAERAQEIAHSTPKNSPDDFKVRNSLITALNHFELLTRAYEMSAVDQKTVYESFGSIIIDVWVYFAAFVQQMNNDMLADPWPPLRRVCDVWIPERRREEIQKESEKMGKAYEEIQKKVEEARKAREDAETKLKTEKRTGG